MLRWRLSVIELHRVISIKKMLEKDGSVLVAIGLRVKRNCKRPGQRGHDQIISFHYLPRMKLKLRNS